MPSASGRTLEESNLTGTESENERYMAVRAARSHGVPTQKRRTGVAEDAGVARRRPLAQPHAWH